MSSDDRVVVAWHSRMEVFVNIWLQGEDTLEEAISNRRAFPQVYDNPMNAYLDAVELRTEYGVSFNNEAVEKIKTVWDEQLITVYTGVCPFCGKRGEVKVPRRALIRYDNGRGEFIQDAWPDGSPGDREQLKSGIHDECYPKGKED